MTGLTDAQGFVELPVNAATTGDLKVTVTKHNRYPYAATIPVAGAATYVSYHASTIDDDGIGDSVGNGDRRSIRARRSSCRSSSRTSAS